MGKIYVNDDGLYAVVNILFYETKSFHAFKLHPT